MARHAALIQVNHNFSTTSAISFAPIGNPSGHIGLSLSEANSRITHRGADMTVRLPKVVVSSNSKSGDTTVVWNKNGSPSSCSITIPAAATGEFTGTGSVSYTDGDTYSITVTPPGAGAFALIILTLGWDIAAAGAAPIVYGSQWAGGSPGGTSLVRSPLGGQLQWSSASLGHTMQVAGDFEGLGVYVHANANVAATAFSLLVNGSATLNVSVPAGTTGRFEDTGSTAISVGDYVEFGVQKASNTGTISASQAWAHFTPTTAGEAQILNGLNSDTALTSDGPVYRRLAGDSSFMSQTTEASNQTTAPFAGVASRLSTTVQTHNTTGDSTLRLRVNGANGNSVVTIPAGTTGRFEDTSNSDTISAGDLVGYQLTPGTGSGVRSIPSIKFVADQVEPPAVLVAAAGAFALSGADAGLLAGKLLSAAAGAFTLTGVDTVAATTLTANAGAFTLSGVAADLRRTAVLAAEAAAFSITGQAAGGFTGYSVAAETGAFTLTGVDALLTATGAYAIAADAGAFTLSGIDAGQVRAARALTAEAGSFSIVGQDASLVRHLLLTALAGAFTVTGQAAEFARTWGVAAEVGAFVLTGIDASSASNKVLAADAGAFTLAGHNAGLQKAIRMACAAGAYSLAGSDAALGRTRNIIAAAGSFNLAGQAATLASSARVLTASAGAFTLVGQPALFPQIDNRYRRRVSRNFRREIERQESADFPLVFIQITHPLVSEAIRVVSDPKDFTWGGELFQGFTFDIELLSDTDRFPEARLSIQNVDQKIGETLRRLSAPARLRIDVLSASQFDLTVSPRAEIGTADVEYTADALYLIDIEVDVLEITGRIVSWNYAQELWPGLRATQDRCPGLFR